MNPCEKMRQEREDRRWSERIMKQTTEGAKEKNLDGQPAKEGNQITSNSFSILGNDEIVLRSSRIGVVVDNYDLPTINMLTELEMVRHSLNEKAKVINECHDNREDDDVALYKITQVLERGEETPFSDISGGETSETDGFTLVVTKRERRQTKRLSLSGKNQKTNLRK